MESPKIEQIRQTLETWLNKKDWTFDELRRWLKGYELPALGYDREPYSWILYGFPRSSDYFREMAKRIARFLGEVAPYREPTKHFDDSFFNNLFHLAAGLGCKDELGNSLSNVFFYFVEHDTRRKEFFSPRKQYNLNNAFRESLIVNQIDATFRDIWIKGLEGQQVSFLLGDAYSNFRGVLYLSDQNGYPLIDDIGWALKKMADYLEPEINRHEKFRRLTEHIRQVWPPDLFAQDWNEILFRQAMKHDWHEWAIMELEALALSVGAVAGGRHRFLSWDMYGHLAEEVFVDYKIISRKGTLLEVEISEQAVSFLQKIVPSVEGVRRICPRKTSRSVKVASHDRLIEWEGEFERSGQLATAKAIQRARMRILAETRPKEERKRVEQVLAKSAHN